MGIATVYVESDDVLVIVCDGVVSVDDWERMVRAQLDDESGRRQGRRRLADLTTCDLSDLDTADAEHIIDLTGERIGSVVGRREAIVASHAWDLASDFRRTNLAVGCDDNRLRSPRRGVRVAPR